MAEYFKKEFRYTGLQHCKNDNNSDCTGFLITERAWDIVEEIDRIVGGGCFRANGPDNYFLDWVWFHPFARNRKRLKKAWPLFKEKFGKFSVTEPLSAHMKEFVAKHECVAKSSNQ